MEGIVYVLFRHSGTDSDLELNSTGEEEEEQGRATNNDSNTSGSRVQESQERMGNEDKPLAKDEGAEREERPPKIQMYQNPLYLIKLDDEDKGQPKVKDKSWASRRRLLHRPGPFTPTTTQETYKPHPRLACCQPSYPKKPFPQPWGVPVNPPKKLGHPTCPPAANMDKLNVMNHAKSVLTKYYDSYLCPADESDDM